MAEEKKSNKKTNNDPLADKNKPNKDKETKKKPPLDQDLVTGERNKGSK